MKTVRPTELVKEDNGIKWLNYYGVSYDFLSGKFDAIITMPNGVQQNCGSYDTSIEAAEAYNDAAIDAYGEDAVINMIIAEEKTEERRLVGIADSESFLWCIFAATKSRGYYTSNDSQPIKGASIFKTLCKRLGYTEPVLFDGQQRNRWKGDTPPSDVQIKTLLIEYEAYTKRKTTALPQEVEHVPTLKNIQNEIMEIKKMVSVLYEQLS